jgi:hypothetical protein
MSTIKSSAEHLTLNADGASKDIKFQANGVEKASISSAGAFTSTTIDATALTGDLPAISGASITGILPLTGGTMTGSVTSSTDTDTSNTGSVTLDFSTNQNFVLTLTGNTTLANPTTETAGQSGFIVLIQDGTGGRTLGIGDQFFTPGNEAITLSSGAADVDIIPYVVQAAGKILLGVAQLDFS